MTRRYIEIEQETTVHCDVEFDDIVEQLDEEERRDLAERLVGVSEARRMEGSLVGDMGPRGFSLLMPDAVWRFGLPTLNDSLRLEGFELIDHRGGASR